MPVVTEEARREYLSIGQAQVIAADMLRDLGIDPDKVRAVTLHMRVGELPTLDVEYLIITGFDVTEHIRKFTLRPKE